jgi:hypothetical protein
MIRKTLILISALVAGTTFAAPPDLVEAPVEIIGAEFGLFDARNPGELVFEPGDVVPHKVGQRYGWIIEVRTTRRALSVREEYLLPGPPRSMSAPDPLSESLNIPTERRNQVSQRQLVPVEGKINGEWAVGENEPAGHRRLQVVIEGHVAASFEYDVK